MTLTEYIKGLTDLLEEHPEAANLSVCTAIDDEGNGYNLVHYSPQLVLMNDWDIIYQDSDDDEIEPPNMVVVN